MRDHVRASCLEGEGVVVLMQHVPVETKSEFHGNDPISGIAGKRHLHAEDLADHISRHVRFSSRGKLGDLSPDP